ncbi:MAG: zinc-ribbon domain-containing protein [Polyangiaceae bacterium]
MDVQCERCKAEYEFDDALVSGRGTTVRCTACGHQFRLRPKGGTMPPGVEDRWLVLRADGSQETFTTLRELQQAIVAKRIVRTDKLTRGPGPARDLGTIAELESFFRESASTEAAASIHDARTAHMPRPSAVPPPRAPAPPPAAIDDDFPETVRRPSADEERVEGGFPAPPRVDPGTSYVPHQPSAGRARMSPLPPPPKRNSRRPSLQGSVESQSPLPPPGARDRGRGSSHDIESTFSESGAMEDLAVLPRKRRLGGWLVAAVLLAGVVVVGVVVGKPYLQKSQADATAAPPLDPRVLKFLQDGERGLSEGNLDLARENFDKASALADQHPRVLLDAARYTSLVADIAWLRMKLVRDEASDEARLAKQSLEDLSGRAKSSAELALRSAADDPKAVRVKIDALRIAGDRDGARALVPKVASIASEPETVYSLAALDLAEPSPPWASIVERLRPAATGEGNLGRARAALVYSLAKSGDGSGARSELARLEALPRAHVLLPTLRALVESTPVKAATDAGIADGGRKDGAPPTVDVASLPSSPTGGPPPPTPGGGGSPQGGGAVPSGDSRSLLAQADQAARKGDYDRARALYDSAVAQNPSDSEALTGLGDVARARHDLLGAQSYYRRALANNPSYLPALIGIADTQWELGDHATAQKTYRDVVDRFPEGTYPPRAKTRLEGPKPQDPPPGPTAGNPTPTGTPPAPTATATPGDPPTGMIQ